MSVYSGTSRSSRFPKFHIEVEEEKEPVRAALINAMSYVLTQYTNNVNDIMTAHISIYQ
jgi:hypothetical protein